MTRRREVHRHIIKPCVVLRMNRGRQRFAAGGMLEVPEIERDGIDPVVSRRLHLCESAVRTAA